MAIGTTDTPRSADAAASAREEVRSRDPSLLTAAAELNASFRELAGSYFELVKLESTQAGVRFGIVAGIAFAALFLVMAAWLSLGVAIAFWIDPDYVGWYIAGFALLNLILVGGLGMYALSLIRQPLFAATRRQLGGARASSGAQ